MIRIGIIGVGYWGPNLVRSFNSIDDCRVTAVCDRDANRLKQTLNGREMNGASQKTGCKYILSLIQVKSSGPYPPAA